MNTRNALTGMSLLLEFAKWLRANQQLKHKTAEELVAMFAQVNQDAKDAYDEWLDATQPASE